MLLAAAGRKHTLPPSMRAGGVVGGTVENAIERLRAVRPNITIFATIGPCIGMRKAFKVGHEVLDAFIRGLLGTRGPIVRHANGKGNVDLR